MEEHQDQRWQQAEEARKGRHGPIDPPPCPPGWEIGPPTFVGIGAQKAGTTWWCNHLHNHPGAVDTIRKELHYFQHGWRENFDDEAAAFYHRYFPRRPGIVTGEWTPRYMMDPWTPPRLRKSAPDAKLLVLLRDPISRLRSGLRHHVARMGAVHPRFVIEAIERGRYGTQMSRVLDAFPREQVLLLQFELCTRDPEREIARTYEFVGLDPGFKPDDLHQPVFTGRGDPVVLPDDLNRYATDLYHQEIELLAELWPELDLSLWPTAGGRRTERVELA